MLSVDEKNAARDRQYFAALGIDPSRYSARPLELGPGPDTRKFILHKIEEGHFFGDSAEVQKKTREHNEKCLMREVEGALYRHYHTLKLHLDRNGKSVILPGYAPTIVRAKEEGYQYLLDYVPLVWEWFYNYRADSDYPFARYLSQVGEGVLQSYEASIFVSFQNSLENTITEIVEQQCAKTAVVEQHADEMESFEEEESQLPSIVSSEDALRAQVEEALVREQSALKSLTRQVGMGSLEEYVPLTADKGDASYRFLCRCMPIVWKWFQRHKVPFNKHLKEVDDGILSSDSQTFTDFQQRLEQTLVDTIGSHVAVVILAKTPAPRWDNKTQQGAVIPRANTPSAGALVAKQHKDMGVSFLPQFIFVKEAGVQMVIALLPSRNASCLSRNTVLTLAANQGASLLDMSLILRRLLDCQRQRFNGKAATATSVNNGALVTQPTQPSVTALLTIQGSTCDTNSPSSVIIEDVTDEPGLSAGAAVRKTSAAKTVSVLRNGTLSGSQHSSDTSARVSQSFLGVSPTAGPLLLKEKGVASSNRGVSRRVVNKNPMDDPYIGGLLGLMRLIIARNRSFKIMTLPSFVFSCLSLKDNHCLSNNTFDTLKKVLGGETFEKNLGVGQDELPNFVFTRTSHIIFSQAVVLLACRHEMLGGIKDGETVHQLSRQRVLAEGKIETALKRSKWCVFEGWRRLANPGAVDKESFYERCEEEVKPLEGLRTGLR